MKNRDKKSTSLEWEEKVNQLKLKYNRNKDDSKKHRKSGRLPDDAKGI